MLFAAGNLQQKPAAGGRHLPFGQDSIFDHLKMSSTITHIHSSLLIFKYAKIESPQRWHGAPGSFEPTSKRSSIIHVVFLLGVLPKSLCFSPFSYGYHTLLHLLFNPLTKFC